MLWISKDNFNGKTLKQNTNEKKLFIALYSFIWL